MRRAQDRWPRPYPCISSPGGRPQRWSSAALRPSVRSFRPGRIEARNALIGGAIGAAAGVVFCTAVSTITDDSADGGLSFCPLDSYLLIGGAGFALGFGVGWVI